ncbi:membrane protein [Catenulispora sp. GAS73]|uniref:YhjD/YihY/BrkB family envelope integrity protein n=1 Tax=Catenulispora sp. GAS73 TaxID=3156269 RepID=UPI0035159813
MGDRGGTAARRLRQRFARLAGAVQEHRSELQTRHPKLAEIIRVALAPETIDRCFAVAAQIFITAVPITLAVLAFLPEALRDRVRESLSSQLGIEGSAAQAVHAFFDGQDSLRDAIGVVGLVLALASATSLTRRLQRLYERSWSLPPGRMRASVLRWIAWVLVWVAVLSAQGPLRAGVGWWRFLGWSASAAMSVGLWWWTPRLLLLRRVGWRQLLPTALLTGLAQTAIGIGSRFVMPRVTGRSVSEYGPFGLVLSLMSWLLVVAGAIVIGAGIGRVLAAPAVSHAHDR